MSVLQVRDLRVTLALGGGDSAEVVRGAGFDVAAGERLGLIGNSGSGKTTTVMALMGLLPPSARVSGQVLLRGDDILRGGETTIRPHRWRDVALVPQGAMNALNPVQRIGDQIAEPIELHGIAAGAEARHRVAELLELVGIPRSDADRYPHELSGGMRQRVVIAMALSCDPAVLLADEPTTALDVVVQEQILEVLYEAARAKGLALVLVTHDLAVVAQTCDRVAVMHDGRVIEQGSVDDVYLRPAQRHTQELLFAARQLSGPRGEPPADARTAHELADVTLEVTGLRAVHRRPQTLRRVLRRRPPPEVCAVDGISLEIRAGEALALVGESGCGKTTAAMSILRLHEPSGGVVTVGGRDVLAMPAAELRRWRSHAQLVFQDPYAALEPRVAAGRVVEEPLAVHRIGASRDERRSRAAAALMGCGLVPAEVFALRHPHELSGGERQRVALAGAAVLEPALLIADEPVSMVDASVRGAILSLLSAMCRGRLMALLLITHDLLSAAWISDRIAVMYRGRIVETGPARELLARPLHPYSKALVAATPRMEREPRRPPTLRGEAEGALPPEGCRFRARCPLADAECARVDPELRPVRDDADDAHLVACIHV